MGKVIAFTSSFDSFLVLFYNLSLIINELQTAVESAVRNQL